MAKGTLNITSGGFEGSEDIADNTKITLTCGTTNTSTTVTAASTTGMIVGATVTGTGIPISATVISIIKNTSFILSAAATATVGIVV